MDFCKHCFSKILQLKDSIWWSSIYHLVSSPSIVLFPFLSFFVKLQFSISNPNNPRHGGNVLNHSDLEFNHDVLMDNISKIKLDIIKDIIYHFGLSYRTNVKTEMQAAVLIHKIHSDSTCQSVQQAECIHKRVRDRLKDRQTEGEGSSHYTGWDVCVADWILNIQRRNPSEKPVAPLRSSLAPLPARSWPSLPLQILLLIEPRLGSETQPPSAQREQASHLCQSCHLN